MKHKSSSLLLASLAGLLLAAAHPAGAAGARSGLSPCPTQGEGVVSTDLASCVVFTPTAAGAAPKGANADDNNYALAPNNGGDGVLVLFLNGSDGSPARVVDNPQQNIYTAVVQAGHHVIGLAYDSVDAVDKLCGNNAGADACFLPTRMTLATGVYQTGADDDLRYIMPSEGIYSRFALALTYLAQNDPQGGWDQFLNSRVDPNSNPSGAINWKNVIVSGHSQGGGHATLLAKLNPVRNAIVLAAPCDEELGTPATWLHYDPNTWVTNPATGFIGFAAPTKFNSKNDPVGGDTICPYHTANWSVMGLAPANSLDNAAVCGPTPDDAHDAPIKCKTNFNQLSDLFK